MSLNERKCLFFTKPFFEYLFKNCTVFNKLVNFLIGLSGVSLLILIPIILFQWIKLKIVPVGMLFFVYIFFLFFCPVLGKGYCL